MWRRNAVRSIMASPRAREPAHNRNESVSTACLEAQRKFRTKRIVREQCPVPNSVWTEPLAGRPTVAGCALPGTAKNQKQYCISCMLLKPTVLMTLSELQLATIYNVCHSERSEESLFSAAQTEERFLASLGMTEESLHKP